MNNNSKYGIVDVVLNTTGNAMFWNDVLEINDCNDWTPKLVTFRIPIVETDQNVTRQLNSYPAFNGSFDYLDKILTVEEILQVNTVVNNEVPVANVIQSTNVIPKQGETIADLVLNNLGSIDYWKELLNVNNLTSWTNRPERIVLPIVSIDQNVLRQLAKYPSCNYVDVESQIAAASETLLANEIVNTDTPEPTMPPETGYTVRQGEDITDVLLNSTGDLINWDSILNENDLISWSPNLSVGQKIKLPLNIQTDQNIVRQLNKYPACDFVYNIDNLLSEIEAIIADVWILRTGYWDDFGRWIDTSNWID